MNTYYANVGKETNESVEKSKKSAQSYLSNHIGTNASELEFHDVSSQDIIESCKRFKPKTS